MGHPLGLYDCWLNDAPGTLEERRMVPQELLEGEGRKKRKLIVMEHCQFREGKRNGVQSLRIEKETRVPSLEFRKRNEVPSLEVRKEEWSQYFGVQKKRMES